MRAHIMLVLTTICYAFIGIFVRMIDSLSLIHI